MNNPVFGEKDPKTVRFLAKTTQISWSKSDFHNATSVIFWNHNSKKNLALWALGFKFWDMACLFQSLWSGSIKVYLDFETIKNGNPLLMHDIGIFLWPKSFGKTLGQKW